MNASTLNEMFEKLGTKFDSFFSQIPKDHKALIQKTLSDWQNWYFGDAYGEWPVEGVETWNDAYTLANNLIDKDIKVKKLKAKKPKEYKPTSIIEIKTPTVVYARAPRSVFVGLLLAGLAIGGVGYYSAKGLK